MSIQFIIGRAGTGKSAACVAAIHAAQAAAPLGPPLLYIVPEQATFSAERFLLTAADSPGGSFRAQVLSFPRLAYLLAQDLALNRAAQPMNDLVRLVLLEEKIRECRAELQIFSAVADQPGFIRGMDKTLRELRRHNHSAGSLRKLLEAPNLDLVTARKLTDLALLLEKWSPVIDAADAWDPEHLLRVAADHAANSRYLMGAEIWVDGFSALSPLEINLLLALAKTAADLTITLTADPDSANMQQLRGAGHNLFSRPERMYRQLLDALARNHIEVAPAKLLRESHRFHSSALQKIEWQLFSESAPQNKSREKTETPAVEIWECSDPETEVRLVAQSIRNTVLTTPARYRNIGLIIPTLDSDASGTQYEDAIRRIFHEHDIPHFIDRRRTIAHHPLVELLRTALAIALRHWDQDDLLVYLKTGLAQIDESAAQLAENYLLAHGITHVPWSAHWEWFAPNQKEDPGEEISPAAAETLRRANIVRQKIWNDLQPFLDAITPINEPRDASLYIHALQSLLARLNVESQITILIEKARADKNPELAQIHEQAWRQVTDLLTLLAEKLTRHPRTAEEFDRLLSAALESLTLGLIPPTVDQVLVSSVKRSRVPELDAVYILGAIEGAFPHVAQEDPILSDTQRDALNDHAENSIGPSAQRQLLETEFFDYVAFTRARKNLVITYPIANRQGKSVSRSRYIDRVSELLGSDLTHRRFDAASGRSIERIAGIDDLLSAAAGWARDLLIRRQLAPTPTMQSLYNWLITAQTPALLAAREIVWPALLEKSPPQLALALANEFYPPAKPLRISVSQLEKFAACPLQYFMHYTLGLRPREILQLDSMDLGLLYHSILERIFLQIIAKEFPWPDCTPEQLETAVSFHTDGACQELHEELANRTAAYDKMKARTKRTLTLIMEAQRRRALQGTLRPAGVEVSFGGAGEKNSHVHPSDKKFSLPVLRIPTTAAGHRTEVQLNGKIDRIDTSASHAAIFDYKSSNQRTLPLSHIYFGIALQLPVYAVVMQTLARLQPVAALYIPLGLKRKNTKRPMDAALPTADPFFQSIKPRGLIDDAGAPELDQNIASGKSPWFNMVYNKDGQIRKNTDLLSHADFTLMLRFAQHKISTMASELMEGKIAPAPYRDKAKTPCEYCDFAPLCLFDRAAGHYRNLPTLKNEEALDAMRADMEQAP